MKRSLWSLRQLCRIEKSVVKQAFRWWLLSVLSLLPAATMAQADSVNLTHHKGQMPRAPDAIKAHGPDLFGDRINLYDGSFAFEQTDVSLTGNSDLPIAVSRKWAARAWAVRGAMADWDVETPRIQGTFANPEGFVPWGGSAATRCSGFGAPPGVTRGPPNDPAPYLRLPGVPTKQIAPALSSTGTSLKKGQLTANSIGQDFSSFEYWGGTYVIVPGLGSQEILKRTADNAAKPADGGSYPLVTPQNWQIGCLNSLSNAVGQGFTAVLPDGTRYRFDWHATRFQTTMNRGETQLARKDHFIMATEVTDRFGNWVRYTYDPANPMNLTRIEANDGRVITLGYSNGRVSSVFDRTRTWYYQYASNGDLQSVVLPDQSRWSFDMRPMVYPNNLISESGPGCDLLPDVPGGIYVGRMTHPSGAGGTFTSHFAAHGRTNVTRSCPTIPGTSWEDSPIWPKSLVTQTLTKKEITGSGMLPMVWNYSVGIGNDPWGAWAPCASCAGSKVTAVTEPDGSVTRHTFGIRWRENEGQLLKLEEGAASLAGPAMRTTTFAYRNAVAGQCHPDRWGDSELFTSDHLSTRNRPQDSRITLQQGISFSWLADPGPQGFDCFAKPARFTQASSLGFSRQTQTMYENNLPKWVLGQVKQVTDLGSLQVPQAYDYDPVTARLVRSYAFGLLKSRYGYHGDGTLYTVANAVNPPTVLSNYWLGVPRDVAFPDGTNQRALVDNLGLVTSHTNEAGTTTTYTYDAMGRVASISYPTGDPVVYAPTIQSFNQNFVNEYGLAPGHWRQTVSTGSGYRYRYFDALWRPRLDVIYDANNTAGTLSFKETRYDADNRKSFEGYPSRAFSAVDQSIAGVSTSYDGLDRVVQQRADSELGPLVTATHYEPGFKRLVINPRGQRHTFAFQAFDTPNEDHITAIWAPENASTGIARDVFGKALSITRSGNWQGSDQYQTRSYVYDAHQRLCKTVEPEAGATIVAYDAANLVAWRASGQTQTGTAACDQGSVAPSATVYFSYDARDRLTWTTYGDGSQAVTRSYTPDGLINRIGTTGGGVNPITWVYAYNNRRLLTNEGYNFGSPLYWNFTWTIDANGHVSALGDRMGVISFAPNALGQATQVGSYATGVTYHPNGAVASYTLGNLVRHTLTQNVRGLPETMQDAGVVHNNHTYDANGNVTAIHDWMPGGANSRIMPLYDGLDRLRVAHGPWGSATFSYDALDNLVGSSVGARSLTHRVDPATNRLVELIGSQNLSIGYDANGNITQRGTQGFVFDIGNRMRSATDKARYVYDGHGRRNIAFFTGGDLLQQAYTQDGKLRYTRRLSQGERRHVFLGDKLIAETSVAGVTTYAHTDALGSPVAWTASSAGPNGAAQVLSTTRYEPYGATVAGSAVPATIGFTGHVNDADTGLVYMQQRYYDPIAGRFLSVDPVVTDQKTGSSFNRYVYGNNNPYRFKDPDGRFALPLIPLIIEAVATAVASNAGAAVVGIAGGVAIGAAINATSTQGDSKGAQATPPAAGTPSGSGKGATPTAPETRAGNVAKGVPESQLGPSGKPKIHVVDHGGDRKGAKDAARAEVGSGGTATNHTSPAVGKDHYHGETQSGEKSRTHHEYK